MTMTRYRSLALLGALVLAAWLSTTSSARAETIAYVSTFSRQFGTLDLATGAYTQLGTFSGGAALYGMGFGADGDLYGLDNRSNSRLHRIDPTNGAATDLGAIGRPIVGAGASPDGELIALDGYSSARLYSLTPPSTSSTNLSLTGISGSGLVAVSPAGLIYYTEYTPFDDPLYVYDPNSGTHTVVGQTGLQLVTGAFVNDTLYGISYDNDLYTIDVTTGAASLVAAITISPSQFFTAIAVTPVPEPGTLALAAVAGLALVTVIKRKRKATQI